MDLSVEEQRFSRSEGEELIIKRVKDEWDSLKRIEQSKSDSKWSNPRLDLSERADERPK